MYMKSVLALSVFTVSTLFGASSIAAEQPVAQPASEPSAEQVQEPKKAVKHKRKRHHKRHKHHKKHAHKHHHHDVVHHHHKHHRKHYLLGLFNPSVDWEENWLLGVDFGYGRRKVDFVTNYVAPVVPLPLNTNNVYSSMMSDQGFFYGVLGGWQTRYKRFMFGMEANLDANTQQDQVKSFAFSNTMVNVPAGIIHGFSGHTMYNRGPIFAFTGRAGWFVTPGFMPYVRLGAQVSRDNVTYEVGESVAIPFQQTVVAGFLPDYSSRKKTIYGAVAGIGAEFPTFIGASTLRLEYNFTKTQSMVINDWALPIQGTHKFCAPQTNVLKAAWVWNFL